MALSISLLTSFAQDRLQHVSEFLNYAMFMSSTFLTSVTQVFRNSTLIISRRSLNTSATVMADTPIQRPSCPPMSLMRFSSCKKENSYKSIVPTFLVKFAFEPNGPSGRRFSLVSVAGVILHPLPGRDSCSSQGLPGPKRERKSHYGG